MPRGEPGLIPRAGYEKALDIWLQWCQRRPYRGPGLWSPLDGNEAILWYQPPQVGVLISCWITLKKPHMASYLLKPTFNWEGCEKVKRFIYLLFCEIPNLSIFHLNLFYTMNLMWRTFKFWIDSAHWKQVVYFYLSCKEREREWKTTNITLVVLLWIMASTCHY